MTAENNIRSLKPAIIRRIRGFLAATGATGGIRIISAVAGLAGPVALGVAAGHPQAGIAAGLGGMALGGAGTGPAPHGHIAPLLCRLSAGVAAMGTGVAVSGHGLFTACALPAVAAVAGILGSISRPLARATTLYFLFTILAASLTAPRRHPLGMLFAFAAGAVWAGGLDLGLRFLTRSSASDAFPDGATASAAPPKYTAKQLLRRWRYSLKYLSGWQYPLRITLCLAAAETLQWVWPLDHGYWISITIVVVVYRDLQAALKRAVQRAAGTALGVVLISLLMPASLPAWAATLLIAFFAALRPVFLRSNYMAYAAVHTPLIILLLDFGRTSSWTLATDRLAATLAGCAISLTLGYLLWLRLFSSSHPRIEHTRLRPETISKSHGLP